ncbi:hypothetical protein SUGI_0397840 [Cryptomeria japonica]|uniref:F-box/kelch-repeat protein At5g42350 n=1 Tax=Cryptomeria japonica TaxID=3369 RepID=UPI002408D63B|nr:F-box/kelch-repeat protein At5g42350 [Cryptomeria japonica]GLJ21514.1 hypothetical protein SUGI_0397840 [Cryptomeria japonica]
MAACIPFSVSRAGSRKNFFCEDQVKDKDENTSFEESGQEHFVRSLSVPKKLVRSVSLKLRKLNLKFDQEGEGMVDEETRIHTIHREDQGKERWESSKCLGLYGKGNRCRVGDDISEDMGRGNDKPRKVVDGDCIASVRGNPDIDVDCRREFHGCLDLDARFERLREWNRGDSQGDKSCKSIGKKKATDIDSTGGSLIYSVDEEGEWANKRERSHLECFAYGGTNKFWRRNSKRLVERRNAMSSKEERHVSLPDDIIEMCLARASLISLMNARLVCKKWRMLTSSPHFMQMRTAYLSQKPWLFLFGLSRDGVSVGQIQALDTAMNKWYRLDAEILKGRFMFSVACAGSSIYVIGGCSTSNCPGGGIDKTKYKTHKAVLVYSPFIGSWKKIAPMKSARALPVVGVFDAYCSSNGMSGLSIRQGRRSIEQDGNEEEGQSVGKLSTIQGGGVASCSTSRSLESRRNRHSEVYGGSQNVSGKRQLWEVLQGMKISGSQGALPFSSAPDLGKIARGEVSAEDRDQSKPKETKAFAIIVVGGHGLWNEPLDSAEIYDSASNSWREIARLPADHGRVCAGVVCNGVFYVYSESDKLAAYDFEKDSWIGIQMAHSPVRLPEYLPKLVSCNGRLFMLCVSWCERDERENGRDKATRKLWELDLSSYSWTEISRHPDAPLDWNASFVGNGDQIYGVEMFKIFGQVLDFVTVCDVSGPNFKWSRISREHVAQDMDASSCMTKAAVIVQL